MEQSLKDAKSRLFDRLDECLIESAVSLGKRSSVPSTDDVYLLRDLADRHYFLTTQHEFTPAEVDALLYFDDPLFVAETCWCENGEIDDLDICAALDSIHAYDRFDLSLEERRRRLEPQVQQLEELPGENYASDLASPEYLAKMADSYLTFSDQKTDRSSIRDQLQKAIRKAGQRPPQDSQSPHRLDTPNL